MSKRKKIKEKSTTENLPDQIKKLVRGLYYTSETDAEILPFIGEKADSVTEEEIAAQTGSKTGQAIEERSFDDFFSRLTEMQDWFGEEEKQTAQKFSELKELLQKELKDLKVFKIGAIELDIYVVGLDAQGILCGIKTKAVET
jgi:hypothetical protein